MNHFRSLSAVILATTIFTLPKLAHAEEATAQGRGYATAPSVPRLSNGEVFGAPGHIVISDEVGFNIRWAHTTTDGPSASIFTFTMQPGIDYFLMNNFSLGAYMALNYAHSNGDHLTNFAIGGRAGYNIWIMEHFSVWPRAGLSYTSNHQFGGIESSSLTLNLSAPLLVHAANFFVGLSPNLDVDLTGDSKTTSIAGRLIVGGWL